MKTRMGFSRWLVVAVLLLWVSPGLGGPGSSGGNPAQATFQSFKHNFMIKAPYPTSVVNSLNGVGFDFALIGEHMEIDSISGQATGCLLTGYKSVCVESVTETTAQAVILFLSGEAFRVTLSSRQRRSLQDMRSWLETVTLGFALGRG